MDLDRVTELLDRVAFTDWLFAVGQMGDGFYVQVKFVVAGDLQHGRKWYVSPFSTPSEVIQTALKAVLTAVEHEARELFRFDGEAVFSPHFSIDALYGLAAERRFERRVG